MDEAAVAEVRLLGLPPLPEVREGDDLSGMIADAIERSGLGLQDGDVLVVTHKVISKAEGRLVNLRDVEPSAFAAEFAARFGKDPRQVETALREAARIVRMDRGILIAETRHGFVCANAGVDASNVGEEVVCLLPVDPDRSAAKIRADLDERFETGPAVIVSDSFGRPWRSGIVNVAIGVAGMAPLADYRGKTDPAGYELHVSIIAVADELASAAELVMHKLDRRPIVLVRGYRHPIDAPHGSGRDLVMDPGRDLFR
jgi:coenzyme F420-0:L-glutamate ligase / coenzyme F420-1:gamma-L-glutamate ligase